ncbi:hypothetical protein [Microbacterium sp. KR10-403]|uniref:IS1096 element passenger TnpR family protein n=1 Tax=Microbacterium sp. KR10-403 TaxID=3158581 RepID=UPI0032E5285F
MTTTTVESALSLTVVLRGVDPPVERTLAVGAHHTLADVHRAIQIAFDGDTDARHVFSDQEPFPGGFPASPEYERDVCAWYRGQEHYGWRPRRRWGDTWTMIDWRDPNVLSESTAGVTDAFAGSSRLHYRCDDPCGRGDDAWFTIDARESAADPSALRVVSGRGRSPLSLFAVAEYAQLLREYSDGQHPEHDAAVARLTRACGPWDGFDPRGFDPRWAQQRLDRLHDYSGTRERTVLDAVAEQLPSSNASGLQRHLLSHGLHVPPTVTPGDAARFVRPYSWFIEHCREGLPLEDGLLTPEHQWEWVDATECDPARFAVFQASARALKLVRTLQGRLLTLKGALPLADDPLALWERVAREFPEGRRYTVRLAEVLFFLAIVDGSISREGDDGGLQRIARVHDLLERPDRTRHPRHWAEPWNELWDDEPAALPNRPVAVDTSAVGTLIAPLAERLEPLGLTPVTPGTWTATPLLKEFARSVLTMRTTASVASRTWEYGRADF